MPFIMPSSLRGRMTFEQAISVEKNFKLTIEYDGTAYHGWQRQTRDSSIQGAIEKALGKMTGQQVNLIGSGRTDAGVHALGQVANFRCETTLTPQAFLGGLNGLLSSDIVIRDCSQVDVDFHARYDVKGKTYVYRLTNQDLPGAIGRQYTWWIKKTLDTKAMEAALQHIIGTHDFKAFEGTGSPRAHTTRSVTEASLQSMRKGCLVFKISANGFLRYMVRNIVGTLVAVGLGKMRPDDVERILTSKDRSQAAATAPPQGLFLVTVDY
jgi:tRNA pseudouridine38-40 synthase